MRWGLVLLAIPMSTMVLAQAKPQKPAPGSSVRKAVLDAARPVLERDLSGKKLKFRVDHLSVQAGWAFFTGTVLKPDGAKFDYHGTRYWELIQEGMFDDGLAVLMRQSGGKWRVKAFTVGATDVPWVEWPKQYGAPRRIFPFPSN